MDYDDVLKEIGDYGPFQKRLLAITLIPIVYNAFGGSVNNFILGNHKYRCKIPWLPNDTYKIQNEFHSSVINKTIPLKKDGSYESCYIINNGTKEKCHDWVFDFSVFTQTVNSQYKAVCDDELLVNHATMSYYFGGLVAAVILTPLSDFFGRRLISCLSFTIQLISNVAMPFSVNIYMFAALRFFDGFCAQTIYSTVFVITLEMVGPAKRHILATFVPLAFDVGNFILVFLAYFIRDWRWLQLSLTAPMIIAILTWWRTLLPESPRWLLSRGRTKEAMKIIKKAAKVNGRTFSIESKSINLDQKDDGGMLLIMKSLFKSRTLIVRLIINLINWFVMAFIYYGVTLNIGFLGENLYLTYTINAVVEMLGNCLQFFLNKTGRRRMYLANMTSMAVFFVASVFTNLYINPNSDLNWITVTLTMIGKLLISLGYGIIYVYTGELFPTVVRGGVIGMCAFAAAVASLITPYLYELGDGKMKTTLPLILYAATTIVAAVSSAFLPETTNVNLQEKIKNVDDNDKVKNDEKDDKLTTYL